MRNVSLSKPPKIYQNGGSTPIFQKPPLYLRNPEDLRSLSFPLLLPLSSLSQRSCERSENLARNASNLQSQSAQSTTMCFSEVSVRVEEDPQPQSKTQTPTNSHFLVLESSTTNLLHFRNSLETSSQKFGSVDRLVDCETLQSSVRGFFN